MYDTIKFVIKESELDNAICFLEEIPCRISIKSTSSNRVVGFLKNMKIEERILDWHCFSFLEKYVSVQGHTSACSYKNNK